MQVVVEVGLCGRRQPVQELRQTGGGAARSSAASALRLSCFVPASCLAPSHHSHTHPGTPHLADVVQQSWLTLVDGHRGGGVSGQHVDAALCHAQARHLGADLGRDVYNVYAWLGFHLKLGVVEHRGAGAAARRCAHRRCGCTPSGPRPSRRQPRRRRAAAVDGGRCLHVLAGGVGARLQQSGDGSDCRVGVQRRRRRGRWQLQVGTVLAATL